MTKEEVDWIALHLSVDQTRAGLAQGVPEAQVAAMLFLVEAWWNGNGWDGYYLRGDVYSWAMGNESDRDFPAWFIQYVNGALRFVEYHSNPLSRAERDAMTKEEFAAFLEELRDSFGPYYHGNRTVDMTANRVRCVASMMERLGIGTLRIPEVAGT